MSEKLSTLAEIREGVKSTIQGLFDIQAESHSVVDLAHICVEICDCLDALLERLEMHDKA